MKNVENKNRYDDVYQPKEKEAQKPSKKGYVGRAVRVYQNNLNDDRATPKIALGQTYRAQLKTPDGKEVGFDTLKEKEVRELVTDRVSQDRQDPKSFEKRVPKYGSIIALAKQDSRMVISRRKSQKRLTHNESTAYIENGIKERYRKDHIADDGTPHGYRAAMRNKQLSPKKITPEMLEILGVDNEMPKIRATGKRGIAEVKEKIAQEIDGYPKHVLLNKNQKDLGNRTQREAVRDVVYELIDLYHKAYPEKSMQEIYLLARDAARVISYQTYFDRGHFSGSSHSIKHILHNIELAEKMMDDIAPEHLTAKDRFLVHLVHIYHDIGYTVPMAQHTSNWFLASSDHPLTGGAFIDINKEYFVNLIGEAAFVTLRDSVLLHSHFNANFETKPFSQEEEGKLVEDPEVHPGIVRSVTSGSDCCAVSSDIKLQEFWLNPRVIRTASRLHFAFDSMALHYAHKQVAKARFTGITDEQKLEAIKEKAYEEAKSHLKKTVFITPDLIQGQDYVVQAKKLASSPSALFSEAEYFEAMVNYHNIREQLNSDARAISQEVAELTSNDPKEVEKIANLDYKRLKSALNYNFNLMCIDKAFGQYGAKFMGVRVKSQKDDSETAYMMISDWSPSKANGHLQRVSKSAFEAWKKLGGEFGIDETDIVMYLSEYMNWKNSPEGSKLKEAQRARFVDLQARLNKKGVIDGVKYKEKGELLIIKGPKGKMVIHTDIEGDDLGVKEAFRNVLNSIHDKDMRDAVCEYRAFCEEAVVYLNRIDESQREEALWFIYEQMRTRGQALNRIARKKAEYPATMNEALSIISMVRAIRTQLREAKDEGKLGEAIVKHVEEIKNIKFSFDSYVVQG